VGDIAHGAVSRRPPISLDTMVARTGGYAYAVGKFGICPSFRSSFCRAVPQALACWFAVQVVQALSVALLCARVVLCLASHREPPQRGLVRLLLRELASFFFVFLAAALLVAALGVVRRRKKVANRDIRVWHGAAENGP
jgi:hypothetical protein